MFIESNPNPVGAKLGDCVVRAICIAENKSWESVYVGLCVEGLRFGDMPNGNSVWGSYLEDRGYSCDSIRAYCKECVTVRDFADSHKEGIYILATGSHIVTVINGDYLDTWDSGDEIPMVVWRKG